MDAFELGVLVLVAVAVLACCLAARASAGKRVGDFGARRRHERASASEVARLDAQDLHEMIEAINARRRARGQPERTVADAVREFGRE